LGTEQVELLKLIFKLLKYKIKLLFKYLESMAEYGVVGILDYRRAVYNSESYTCYNVNSGWEISTLVRLVRLLISQNKCLFKTEISRVCHSVNILLL